VRAPRFCQRYARVRGRTSDKIALPPPKNQGVRPQGFSAFLLVPVFRLDSLRVKSQNCSSRDASPKRSVFHPTY
jgi:hypothetical protein